MRIQRVIAVLVLGVLVLGVCQLLLRPAPPQPAPVAPAPASPAVRDPHVLGTAMRLRIQGQFRQAEELLQQEYNTTFDPACGRMLLAIREDSGDPDALVKESRAFLQREPSDRFGQWMLARGLLFAAATHPEDRDVTTWLDQATGLVQKLESARYEPPDSRGGLAVLRTQIAFMRRQWAEADRLAQKSLKVGTTEGESAELVAMRCDLAIRAGRLGDAEALLDRALAMMESWKQPVYYMLRTHQEDALIVREVYFGQPFTKQDLDALDAYHRRLRETGVVDPLSKTDDYKRMHKSMRTWLDLRERGDAAGQLSMIETALANEESSPDTVRCFYSEAIVRPFKRAYFHVAAGDLCKALGRKDDARAHYEKALKSHPDDRIIQLRMKQLEVATAP